VLGIVADIVEFEQLLADFSISANIAFADKVRVGSGNG
jgi:hypothetical protein